MQETQLDPWVGKIPLEKEMAPHSSILAWEIPWTEEPGGLQSVGSQSQTRQHVAHMLIESSLYARRWSKCFLCITTLNAHNTPWMQVIIISEKRKHR